uniref:Diphthine--ammonia ligase n=1 Tax=Tetraselmis sp. GSL018 TaxID=582737 RepID=A0A061RHG0_9CHLO
MFQYVLVPRTWTRDHCLSKSTSKRGLCGRAGQFLLSDSRPQCRCFVCFMLRDAAVSAEVCREGGAEGPRLHRDRGRRGGGPLLPARGCKATDAGDRVDLFCLLAAAKRRMPEIEAVSSGAIASDYQRLRVEDVCSRLGLTSLAYMWHQPQQKLLRRMCESGIEAVLIKVAALGLDPRKHLGRTLAEMEPRLNELCEMYDVNVCGEGGEYETLTLDCPLFTKARIRLEETEVVAFSERDASQGGMLKIRKYSLEPKGGASSVGESPVVDVTGEGPPSCPPRAPRPVPSGRAAACPAERCRASCDQRALRGGEASGGGGDVVVRCPVCVPLSPLHGPLRGGEFGLQQGSRQDVSASESLRRVASRPGHLFTARCSRTKFAASVRLDEANSARTEHLRVGTSLHRSLQPRRRARRSGFHGWTDKP